MLLWLGLFGALFVSTFAATASSSASDSMPAWFLILFVAVFALYGLGAVVTIAGAILGGTGRWWRCPFAIPFIRAHRREHTAGSAVRSSP